jgi:Flp pilus assembly protein TadD
MMQHPKRLVIVTAILLVAVANVFPAGDPVDETFGHELPAGLADFLSARVLESEERYTEAIAAYDRALQQEPEVIEIRVGYADLLLRLGMARRAVELLDGHDALDWHGRKVFALALTQVSVQDTDRMSEAEAALQEVLDERDDDPNLLLSLGQLLHRMGRLAEAEEAIAELRKNRPGSPQLVSYHAALLLQLGRRDQAADLFVECAAGGAAFSHCRDNAAELLVELGRPGEAADVLLASLGDDDLDQLMRAGFLLWEAGRPSQGLQVVNRVLREVPDSERGRTLKAHLLSATGRYEQAATLFRALLKKNPSDIDLKLSIAWAVARSGDLDQARRWLDRTWEQVAVDSASVNAVRCAVTGARIELVADNPLVARSWLNRIGDPKQAGEEFVRLLGESYRQQEEWMEGIGALLRLGPSLSGEARLAAEAIEAEFRFRASDRRAWNRLRPLLDGDHPSTVLLGLQVLQSVERWSDAEREATAALERFPGERDLLFARAAALERLDRFEEAEAAFLELLELEPDDATAANYLGYLWADRDVRLQEALALVNQAVNHDPENPAYLDSLGWVYYRLGALDEAEFWLRRAIAIDDTDGTLHAHLGEVLVARGEIEEGRRSLRLALELGCEHPDHVRSLLDGLDDEPPE